MSKALQIKLLGELEVSFDGQLVELPASKKTRALLGYLAVAAGEHTRSRLCDLLWDGPADPRAALRWSLSKLRPLVNQGDERIVADREHVRLELAGAEVDLFELTESLAGELEALDTELLEACAARFRGELLEGLELGDCFGYTQWLAGHRERTRNLRTRLLATLTTRYDEASERGLVHARTWVALEPLDEGAHASLVEWLARLGRPQEARDAAQACRELFARELGRAPGSRLERASQTHSADAPGVVEREPQPAAPQATPSRDGGLFGRAEECARLEDFLAQAATHATGSVLWIEGEPGIGKSHLLAELLQRGEQRGLATRYGKSFEAESARPLAIWNEVLGGLELPAGATGRVDLFEGLHERIVSLSSEEGVLIALDDVQWIDEVSAALVSWLAREAPSGLLLAIAVRPGELPDNPAASKLLRSLGRDGSLERMALEPLAQAETLALLRSVNGSIDANRAFELAGGHPLFAIELAKSGELGASTRISACISERLERLGDDERVVLRAGAAIGRRFSLELAESVSGLRPGELMRAIEQLERGGFVRPEGSAELDFAHDLVRDVVYNELSDPARRLLHRRIARALEQDPRATAELATELARQATLAEEFALAATACVAAGEHCLRLSANAEAASYAKRGLRHAAHLAGAEGRRVRVELLALRVHAGLGRSHREELQAELEQLSERCGALAEHESARNALYLLSVLDEEHGDFARAEARTLEAVEEGRHADSGTQARALANTGRCLTQLERELPRAEEFLLEASQGELSAGAEVDVAWGSGLLALHLGDFEVARRQLERAFTAAREAGNHWAAFECLSRRLLADLGAQEPALVLEREVELLDAAAHLTGGSELALARGVLALARYASTAEASEQELEGALDELRREDNKAALSMLLNQAAETDLERGRNARSRAFAREALDASRVVGRARQLERARKLLEATSDSQPPEDDR